MHLVSNIHSNDSATSMFSMQLNKLIMAEVRKPRISQEGQMNFTKFVALKEKL